MRLLDTMTLQLVSFRENEIPPYAILSHCWGADEEEVTFQDIQDLKASIRNDPAAMSTHPVTNKIGFAKIRHSAKIAVGSGLGFIWIDTCCIDKSSSAELSEAINSMFRWYQESNVCYAYLHDVQLDKYFEPMTLTQTKMPEMRRYLATSRWFTRGWTLQELIAPRRVVFYDQKWDIILENPLHGQWATRRWQMSRVSIRMYCLGVQNSTT
jgi:hypothetical protein